MNAATELAGRSAWVGPVDRLWNQYLKTEITVLRSGRLNPNATLTVSRLPVVLHCRPLRSRLREYGRTTIQTVPIHAGLTVQDHSELIPCNLQRANSMGNNRIACPTFITIQISVSRHARWAKDTVCIDQRWNSWSRYWAHRGVASIGCDTLPCPASGRWYYREHCSSISLSDGPTFCRPMYLQTSTFSGQCPCSTGCAAELYLPPRSPLHPAE